MTLALDDIVNQRFTSGRIKLDTGSCVVTMPLEELDSILKAAYRLASKTTKQRILDKRENNEQPNAFAAATSIA